MQKITYEHEMNTNCVIRLIVPLQNRTQHVEFVNKKSYFSQFAQRKIGWDRRHLWNDPKLQLRKFFMNFTSKMESQIAQREKKALPKRFQPTEPWWSYVENSLVHVSWARKRRSNEKFMNSYDLHCWTINKKGFEKIIQWKSGIEFPKK